MNMNASVQRNCYGYTYKIKVPVINDYLCAHKKAMRPMCMNP